MKEGLSITLQEPPIISSQYQTTKVHAEHDSNIKEKNNCLYITIPAGKEGHLNLTTKYEQTGFCNIKIVAEKNSTTVITRNIIGSAKHVSEVIEITAEDNATITYNEYQSLQHSTWHNERKGTVKEQGTINWYTHVIGGSRSSQVTTTQLVGERAKTMVLATNHLTKEQEHYSKSVNEHLATGTESGMFGKSVISNNAKALHKGLIIIDKQASNAKGFQREDIILEDDAIADALPELEINNQNVECSHGATIGQLNNEQLFYLRSRGLDEETAKKIIAKGFLASIAEHADEEWKNIILTVQQRQHEDAQ